MIQENCKAPWNAISYKTEQRNYFNKWDLMMSGPASLAVISFIKNWHKKLRLLVDLRIFSKFQGANSHKNEAIKISCQYA